MLKELYGMKYDNNFVFFWTGATPFSNFYKRAFSYKGYTLNYGEQAFMLEKALMFDPSKVDAIVKANNPKALNPNNWKGSNLLGKALMEIRAELQNN